MPATDHSNNRFLEYKNVLKKLKSLGFSRVFSSNLADSLRISASLVRKDFLALTTKGNKRGGYDIDELLNEINRLLCKDTEVKAVLVGMGKLGAALSEYKGFTEENITIDAAFDIDPEKINPDKTMPVFHIDRLTDYIQSNAISIGIIAVPAHSAQQVADNMVLGGITGILNFAPVRLALPEQCYENHINLALELEKVVLHIRRNAP